MSYYENHNLEEDDLPFIYNEINIEESNMMFGPSNWHENIEILYVVGGGGRISNNGEITTARKGNIAVFNANHLHSLSADSEGLLHRYLIVDRSFCLANGIDTSSISFSKMIDDCDVRSLMDEIHSVYSDPHSEPYYTLRIRTLVLRLMLLLCERHSYQKEAAELREGSVNYIKKAIDYIRASYDKNFSLEDAASFVGINKCYLSREFHRYTGYSFVSYVNRTRCKMAQQLLLNDRLCIHEVAIRCGFENRSYFARCFLKHVGMLPSEYRAHSIKPRGVIKVTESKINI